MTAGSKQIDVLVLGLGNELLTDDGVGVHVLRALQEESLPKGVQTLEAGTAILHVQDVLEQAGHVIAIDAVQAGDAPGSIYRLDVGQAQLNKPASLHDLGIVGVLKLMPESLRPQVTILGIEPKVFDYGMQLTPSVQESVRRAVDIAKTMITEVLVS